MLQKEIVSDKNRRNSREGRRLNGIVSLVERSLQWCCCEAARSPWSLDSVLSNGSRFFIVQLPGDKGGFFLLIRGVNLQS